jgi:hypothetical protein
MQVRGCSLRVSGDAGGDGGGSDWTRRSAATLAAARPRPVASRKARQPRTRLARRSSVRSVAAQRDRVVARKRVEAASARDRSCQVHFRCSTPDWSFAGAEGYDSTRGGNNARDSLQLSAARPGNVVLPDGLITRRRRKALASYRRYRNDVTIGAAPRVRRPRIRAAHLPRGGSLQYQRSASEQRCRPTAAPIPRAAPSARTSRSGADRPSSRSAGRGLTVPYEPSTGARAAAHRRVRRATRYASSSAGEISSN